MDVIKWLGIVNDGLIMIYGLFLSVLIAGGWEDRRQKRILLVLCPLFLLVQGILGGMWGVSVVRKIYPLITHLPLALILIFVLKKRVSIAFVSVFTGYLCCQLPRWVNLVVAGISASSLVGELSYTLALAPVYWLLRRFFVRTAHDAMTGSTRSFVLFGSLPLVYYIFDYATVIYTDVLYTGAPALTEFFPTALIIFYLAFFTAYHAKTQERAHAELQKNIMEAELKQAGMELENLRRTERQTAVYQHDMRHHLTAINAFLSAGNIPQAQEYIKKIQEDVEAITPKRFCANELVNLLCSSFVSKAEQNGVRLAVEARLPEKLPVSDTELCSILSNGLENAVCAAAKPEVVDKWVSLFCGVRMSKLLIEIKNSCEGETLWRDGLPVSGQAGHGYGSQSIRAISEQNGGLCSFGASNGVFTLRVVLPLSAREMDER